VSDTDLSIHPGQHCDPGITRAFCFINGNGYVLWV